jgi:hypothetical protein
MRALILLVSVAGAAALSASAVRAQSDRYGPDQTADQRVATLDRSYLAWPGKQAPDSDVGSAQQAEPAEQPAPPPPEAPVAAQPPPPPAEDAGAPAVASLPAVLPAPEPEATPPAPQPVAAAQPAALPAAQPTPAAAAQAAQSSGPAAQQTAEDAGRARLPPHIYSVAREYGLTPDPIPLPTQFFADQQNPDLATPPGPLPPRPVPGAQTVSNPSSINTPSNRARAIAQDTPDPDSSDAQQ